MLSCIFFLLSLSFASASDLKLSDQVFAESNLLSSYYWFRHLKLKDKDNPLPLLGYREFVQKFFLKSPKDCLTIIRDSQDNFFSSFFLRIILDDYISNHFNIIREHKILGVAAVFAELSGHFGRDCIRVAEKLCRIPFIRGNQNEYLDRVEAFETLLYIMKQFAAVLQGGCKQSLNKSYETVKFILLNFKVNDDYFPCYEGFLLTFNTLRSLSLKHGRGKWPNDSDATIADNLIRLFGCYSHHFFHKHFNELPATVPSLLLLLMLLESRCSSYALFLYFSLDSPDDLVTFADPPFSDLYKKLAPFYFIPKKKNQPITEISGKKLPRCTKKQLFCEERSFIIFLHELNTLESGIMPTLEVEDGPPTTLSLDEREKWLIKIFLSLHDRKHLDHLYLTE